MGGGQPLRLGPFIGGLNTASDVTAIADAELAECINFELDIDGSLVSRPPFKEQVGHADWTERIVCLGEAVFSGSYYVIGSNTNGVYYLFGGTWTLITNTFQATVAVQYANTVYLVAKPGSANPGGKWDPSGGFTAVSAIPKGQAGVIHKERLFIAPGVSATTNTSRLTFSDAGNLESWPGSNFIDIGQGDGTNLIDLTVSQDNLLLFKNQSTYILAYDVRPSDAVARKISLTIGVTKQFNVVNYENQVYIFHGGAVYEIINYDFHQINIKVPFIRDDTAPTSFANEDVFLSILKDRLICRFYRKIYVYGFKTRTWSEWSSIQNILHYFGPIVTMHALTGDEYYSGSCLSANKTTIRFFDVYSASNSEQVLATLGTATANGTSATSNYLIATTSDSSDIAVGDSVRLYNSSDVLKENTLFKITRKEITGSDTKNFYTPSAATVPVSGDKIKVLSAITCSIKTKNFDMAISHQFKRLWWWGADVTTDNFIKGIATPVILSFNVTWGALAAYTWGSLGTWGQPLTSPASVETIDTTGTGTSRRFAKFLQSLRYRQINFKLELVTVGTTVDGPARLFTMTIITESKQVVSKAVS